MMAATFGACCAFSDRPSPAVNGVSPRSTHSLGGTLRPAFSTARFCTGRALSPCSQRPRSAPVRRSALPFPTDSSAQPLRKHPLPLSQPAQRQSAHAWAAGHSPASRQTIRAQTHALDDAAQLCPTAGHQTTHPRSPPNHPRINACIEWRCPTLPNRKPPDHESLAPPTKPSAHKRPVDRPVGLRVCRRRYRRRPLADVPKERAAIQLSESKRPFPKRRAAWGWLPAAAFHPANPQPEARAGFLVPFSKKGTSYM